MLNTSSTLFSPLTTDWTMGKAFEKSVNRMCRIPSLVQYVARSFSPSSFCFTKRTSACFAADMSDLVVRKHPVPDNKGGRNRTHTRYAISEKEESWWVGKFSVRQDCPRLVVAVPATGNIDYSITSRKCCDLPRGMAVLDTPLPVRQNVHIV